MKAQSDEAIGVECAWKPAAAPPPPGPAWLALTALLLALGAWQLFGRWVYVLLAFLS
jgi:hypothetical protein